VTTLLDSEGGHRTIELDSEGRSEFLDIINEETDRLNKFIEGMVALARVEAGSVDATGTMSSVEEIIATALDRAEPLLGRHHLEVNFEKELPMVRVDALAIAEVIFNLIENAAKYSPVNSTVTVTAASHGDSIVISVADEGPGIPVDARERVFERFVRLDGTSQGLGLGLAIARGIVEAQKGTIKLKPGANGKGTRAVVTLPIGDE